MERSEGLLNILGAICQWAVLNEVPKDEKKDKKENKDAKLILTEVKKVILKLSLKNAETLYIIVSIKYSPTRIYSDSWRGY